jgi:hypothetical protein
MRRLLPIAAVLASVVVCLHGAASNLVLKLAWAQQYRNQLSIDATVTVLALNSGKEADGDRHGGSRDNAVGLPMVAEILNGALPPEQPGIAALQPGSHPDKKIYGAWRLWVEHPPSGGTQCQSFSGTPPPICANESGPLGADSNPLHSFEIHPVFAVDGVSIAHASMVLTSENQSVKTADAALAEYTGATKVLHVVRTATALTLNSISVQDNYAQAHFRVTKVRTKTLRQQDQTVDGGYVVADWIVGDQTVPGIRVFYYLDSDPGQLLDVAATGQELDLIVMPRINLDAVLSKTDAQGNVAMPLPYEFIALAIKH